MSYQFLDANASVLSADSSIISGVIQRPAVDMASVLSIIPVVVTNNASISGTVNAVQSGLANTSVIGVFTDGTTRTAAGDPGMNVLGYRNDTLASIVSGDKKYTPMAIGQAGEAVTANAPLTQWVQGNASCFTGVTQPVISAQGASVFTYVTSAQIANASANNVYMTIYGGTGSVVSYLPVPANSGAIPLMVNGWKSTANGAFSASISGVASVFLAFQGFISKT